MLNSDTIQQGFKNVQNDICEFLNENNDKSNEEDLWQYKKGNGGGITRVWFGGDLIEKGGVNFSAIRGTSLPQSAATKFKIPEGTEFLATGVSLVIHPWSPFVPTIHMNIRYFEAGDVSWFGGGIDLTPCYPKKEQVIQFHKTLKDVCENSGHDYAIDKATCDDYFYLPHRDETRGVGGIFFDHLQDDKDKHFQYAQNLGYAFRDLYRPFIEQNRDTEYTQDQRDFLLYRRGRYVEFNLVYDRGTIFGLQSNGRTESILMSLPATAKWEYNFKADFGTPEHELTDFYLKPQNWAEMGIDN
jgi:coproporphyrinogen III oxidase